MTNCAGVEWGQMIKEQVLILKIRYDDSVDDPPHTWDWSSLVDNGHVAEVLNHGAEEDAKA